MTLLTKLLNTVIFLIPYPIRASSTITPIPTVVERTEKVMLFRFRRARRQWTLTYTFIYQNTEVYEHDRFLTREEAEQRFRSMVEYHTQRQQPISQAKLIGPQGFYKDLTPTTNTLDDALASDKADVAAPKHYQLSSKFAK